MNYGTQQSSMEYDTPQNIMELTEEEILARVVDRDSRVYTKKENRLKLIKIIYSLLGYKLDKDILLALLSEPESMLVLATAGGGKTTMSQVNAVIEKIVRRDDNGNHLQGKRMLCLVYNTQNVSQMAQKQQELITTLYAKGVTNISLDKDLVCRTMHSFCLEWRNEYTAQMGLLSYTQLSDDGQITLFNTISKVFIKKHELDEKSIKVSVLMQLYNLTHEMMVPYEDMESLTKYEEVDLPVDLTTEFFQAYDNMKRVRKVYDYTDMLTKMKELLETNETARKRIQEHYDYIIVDEFQDLTPIMTEIVRLVKGDHTPLLCIGDEDQCIYNFRGADINNVLMFKEKFPDGEIYSLGANRRCRKEIFEAAKYVISKNSMRFNKPMFCIKDGGQIKMNSYYSTLGQLINIVNDLKNMPESELNDTIICYREQKSSIRLTSILEEHRIPFYVLSGYGPYTHELFKHITDVLDLLYLARDREYLVNLYKVTEMTRTDCIQAIGYDVKTKRCKGENDHKHFLDRNYGKYSNRFGFLKTMQQLDSISKRILTEPMENYFDEVWDLFVKYFWNWKKEQNDNREVDTYFEEQVKKVFKSKLTYQHFIQEFDSRKDKLKSNNVCRTGVAVSTFHKLKGLEFKNVYIIDLDDSIYPNYSRIELQKYNEHTELQLKESEVRLMFVAMTRAKDNLNLYYNANNPSLYVQWLLDWFENRDKSQTQTQSLESFEMDSSMQNNTSGNISLYQENFEQNHSNTEEPAICVEYDEVELEIEDDFTNSAILNSYSNYGEVTLDVEPVESITTSHNNPDLNSVNLSTTTFLEEHNNSSVESANSFKNISTSVLPEDDFMSSITNAESSKEDQTQPQNNNLPLINSNFFLSSVLDRL